jgi:acyl carrier protein
MSTLQRVRNTLYSELGIEPEEIELTSKLEDLGADSMDRVSLVLALEENFGIEIPDDEAKRFRRVYQIVDYVDSHSPSN